MITRSVLHCLSVTTHGTGTQEQDELELGDPRVPRRSIDSEVNNSLAVSPSCPISVFLVSGHTYLNCI